MLNISNYEYYISRKFVPHFYTQISYLVLNMAIPCPFGVDDENRLIKAGR